MQLVTADLGLKCAAFILSLNCIILTAVKRTYRSRHYRGYFLLCLNILICSALAIISGIMDRYLMVDGVRKARFIVETLYALTHCAVGFYLFLYFLEVFDEIRKVKRRMAILTAAPVICLQIVILFNIKYRFVFDIDAQGTYVHEEFWWLLILVPVFHVTVSLIYQLMYARALPKEVLIIALAGQIMGYAGAVIQNAFGWLKVELFGESLTLIVLLLTLENADRFVDYDTGTFNRQSMITVVRCHMVKHQPFGIIDLRMVPVQGTWGFLDREKYKDFMHQVTERVMKVIPYRDLYSYASGHFVAVTDETDKQKLQQKIDALQALVREPWQVGDVQFEASAIVTAFRYPKDVASLDTIHKYMIMDAGLVMDMVHPGRIMNNYLKFRRVMLVEQAIDHARRHRSFDVAFQPIFEVSTMKPVSYEAFIRLDDMVAGEIPPEELIPAAEHLGCIEEVSLLLDRCCEIIYRLHLDKRDVFQVNLNLSNLQLIDESMPFSYVRTVERWGLSPSFFALEITEDSFLKEHPETKDTIHQLKEAGFSIILDKFGSSSNNLISMFKENVDGIKIERDVLWKALDDEKRLDMLKSLIQTMVDAGKQVCQTGVETPDEAEFAMTSGCRYAQGLRLQAPMREEALDSFLKWHEKHGGAKKEGSL
jgi:EAL domain-containing protein (putative c-di-GMP-specific phosphodiesterase class I)